MATAVIMPRQGQSVETCIISKWLRNKGEKVSSGDIIASYETDKAAFDLEAPADGTILEIFYPEGTEVPVLSDIAIIGIPGENIDSLRPVKTVRNEELAGNMTKIVPADQDNRNVKDRKIRISPRARRIAESQGIDVSVISGSGPNGRILSGDLENQASGPLKIKSPVSPYIESFTDTPLSNVRKKIAAAMHQSLMNSAQLTHHMSADVRFVLDARKKIKSVASTPDITMNDILCWCVIRALEKFPEANSHFLDDRIRTFSNVNLGLAVDTPRGLLVAVLTKAESLDLSSLSDELKKLADACRTGNINPELLRSTAASFTVSNLGSYGVEMFTPVINLPQVAILGICTIINRPVDLGNHTFGFVPHVGLSLTYDHRAIDGGPATLFLREIKNQIESFRY